jgi:hypothetical protein
MLMNMLIAHPLNFYAGWGLILAAFVTGAGIGMGFHREDFWGGYASFRRRIVRLGHIALAALGMLNLLFAITVSRTNNAANVASILMVVGAISMPAVCFLSGWKSVFRHLFFIPVLSLIVAVILVLCGGSS